MSRQQKKKESIWIIFEKITPINKENKIVGNLSAIQYLSVCVIVPN